jgi:putative transcriptional regulator
MMLIKILSNVDSFQEEQANNLKIMTKHLDARSFLVGSHTRREKLSDSVLYERFEVPTVTPRAFENLVLNENFPSVYRFRGGLFVEINPESLRAAREQSGLTQSQLADKVGVTKKSVYEHEKKKIRIEYENAVKIEKALKVSLIEPLRTETGPGAASTAPRTAFEAKVYSKFRSIGFNADSVYQSPFNMMAKSSRMLILSDVEESSDKARKKLLYIKEFSKVSDKSAVIITKEETSFDIPSVTQKEFLDMDKRDIRKVVGK